MEIDQEERQDIELDDGFNIEAEETENSGSEAGAVAETPQDKTREVPVENMPEQAPQARQPESLADVPQNIASEMEELKKLNPAVADLAMENSPDGESIRRRLEHYGAESGQDRGEFILERRNRERMAASEQQARIDAHNRQFHETIKSRNPAYYDLITNQNRRAEAQSYFRNIFGWIESKPYSEAKNLMQIAEKGRDPNQICDLIERYEREKGRPDATGALAVPSRGMPYAPAGIGDRDDFDAGWNLNND